MAAAVYAAHIEGALHLGAGHVGRVHALVGRDSHVHDVNPSNPTSDTMYYNCETESESDGVGDQNDIISEASVRLKRAEGGEKHRQKRIESVG